MRSKVIIIFTLFFGAIANFAIAQEEKPITNRFELIKKHIVRRKIYHKLYSKLQKEIIDQAFYTGRSWIYEDYTKIIEDLSIFDIPEFIKQTIQLVKYYNFDLRPVLSLAKEKIVNLYFEEENQHFSSEILKIDALIEISDALSDAPNVPSWFTVPESYGKAWDIYYESRDYVNAPTLFLTAIEDLKNYPIPTNPEPPAHEMEAFRFYQKGYITRSYEYIANCYNFTEKYEASYDYWEKAAFEDGGSNELPFFYKISRRIEMARLKLYHLGDPTGALNRAIELKNEAMQQTGEVLNIKPMQAEAWAFLGECQRYLNKLDDSLTSFTMADDIYNKLLEQYGSNFVFLGLFGLPMGMIHYHIGEIEFQKERFESARLRFSKAIKLFYPDTPNNETYISPRFHERNIVYKQLAAQRTKLTIDLEKSTRFFFPGKVTAKIYYRFKYIPPKSRNFTNFIKLEIFKKNIKEPIHSELIENPQEADELCFEWSGMQGNGLPIEQGDYEAGISYYSVDSSINKKVVLSADRYIIFVGHLWIDEMKTSEYFTIKDEEITECDIAFNISLPNSNQIMYALKLLISDEFGEEVYHYSFDSVQEGPQTFKWKIVYKENEESLKSAATPILPGLYKVSMILESTIGRGKSENYIAESEVTGLYVDMDAIPVTNEINDETTLPELTEYTEGAILPINFHNDPLLEPTLLRLKIHDIWERPDRNVEQSRKFVGKLKFNYNNLAVWLDKERKKRVYPDYTTFDTDKEITVYVENYYPQDEIISYYLIPLNKTNRLYNLYPDEITKADPVEYYSVFWCVGGGTDFAQEFMKYIIINLGGVAFPDNPTFGGPLDFMIPIPIANDSTKYAKLYFAPMNAPESWLQGDLSRALSEEKYKRVKHHVIITAHSNFGAGFGFRKKQITQFEQFYNAGDDLIAFQWHISSSPNYFENLEELSRAIYGDDPSTPTVHYDPWQIRGEVYGGMFRGKGTYEKTVYVPTYAGPPDLGKRLHLTEGSTSSEDYHFLEFDSQTQKYEKVVVIKSGDGDLPTASGKKFTYSTIYLSGCSTGRYFLHKFNHGTVLFTNQALWNSYQCPKWYLAFKLAGKTYSEICQDLVEYTADKRCHDYYIFKEKNNE